ncbi:MAG: arsenite methyltransferase [Candidatus Marinimicrobia bacterium]|nr:arsenite methyltransferase [Candidatus Neomarinimicrobiota bacterium]MCF7904511.1 arsenite methyltransferase [Candidatus Neomarinimicrobiota bacterium]
MTQNIELKTIVKNKYASVVTENSCCCGSGCSDPDDTYVMKEDYTGMDGYVKAADYNLGCGLPTNHAEISEGDTVLDLGSGAGNDAFIVQRIVGDTGQVIGVDFTMEMVTKAVENKNKLGLTNIDFRYGDIEDMPVDNDSIDVVISNCVLNLVPDKEKAFKEIYRVLKPGAHFCVSDIVSKGQIPAELKTSAELYAGCVAGALPKDEYIGLVKDSGFTDIDVRQERSIDLPEHVVRKHLSDEAYRVWKSGETGLLSITLFARKPK